MKQLIIALLLLSGVGLTACSPSSSSTHAVRIRWSSDPQNLDPLATLTANSNALQANNLLYCSLLTVDPKKQTYVPWLAEALPTVKRQDSFTFLSYRLRKAAVWDDGRPVQGADVLFTLKLMNLPGLPNEAARAKFGFIQDVQIDTADYQNFTFLCKGRSLEYVLSSGDFPILPEHALDPQRQLRSFSLRAVQALSEHESAANPVLAALVQRYSAAQLSRNPSRLPGCTAYNLTAWQSGRYLTFQRKANWWGHKIKPIPPQLQANPQSIDFQIIPDNATSLLALRRGDIDIYPMLPAKDFNRLKQSEESQRLAFYTSDSYDMVALGFNTSHPALQDRYTRQALSHLVNVTSLIQGSQQGMAYPSVGLINPHDQRYYNDSLAPVAYAPNRTVALLQQAGWRKQSDNSWVRRSKPGESDQRLSLTISYRINEPAFEAAALQFRTAAGALGIPVQLQPTEATLMSSKLRKGNVDVYLRMLYGNPFNFNFAAILHSRSIGLGNYSRFGTAASDQLIDAIAQEEDSTRKAVLLRRFQKLMQQESPLVVLYFMRNRLAAAKHLAQLNVSGLKPYYYVTTIISKTDPSN
ncbi:ABC transporter substrate-binding protein [Hymenobacter jejuensis]|uniref:Solute-binding protein family 5 domain-containing protein n=1 Tax=Hymenobacter jejuensis TaxID=2502781 RepID=A0A5B8A3W8_9BACT|nr:ABC transporter substrate-binding protein [Hymenobacter jejuensis]QDA60872.1 hypothetical protein FHG12_12495 [Hymenobacter jejuensis]